jgi:NRPS condensation-like uncharacterized protein
VRAWILRSRNDTLVINFQHVASDGGGAKDYLSMLASIYRKLSHDPGFRPEPNLSGSRGLAQVIKNFGPGDYFRIMRRNFRDFYEFMFPLVRKAPPSLKKPPSCGVLMVRGIGPDLFKLLREYGRGRDATVNDMMVTAFLRAFFGPERPGEKSWPRMVGTVDLRRYIPGKKAGAVCNLSGFTYLSIGPRLGATFDETLSLVRDCLSAHKSDFIGMGPLPISALLFRTLPFSAALRVHDWLGNAQKKQASSSRDAALLFSNTGNFDPGAIEFGGVDASLAYVTTTIATPPVLAVVVAGFKERITITAGFCETTVSRSEVIRILDSMEGEIRRLRKSA